MDEMKFNVWSLIWGQSSDLLKTKLKSLLDHGTNKMQKGCACLLTQIRRTCQKIEHNVHPCVAVLNLKKKLCNYEQKEDHNLFNFRAAVFLKRVSTKSRGSSNTTTNAEVMLIQTNTYEVIKHAQLTLFHVLGHKKFWES